VGGGDEVIGYITNYEITRGFDDYRLGDANSYRSRSGGSPRVTFTMIIDDASDLTSFFYGQEPVEIRPANLTDEQKRELAHRLLRELNE
jgi:hypothetical protein